MEKPTGVTRSAFSVLLKVNSSCNMSDHSVAPLQDITTSKYKVGQVWAYQTRSNEPHSVITIVKVELQHGTAVAVHIHVDGLNLKPADPGGIPGTTASHLPFSEEALDASVTNMVDHVVVLPDFEEGYMMWREAFLEGKAGIFSLTVAEVMDFIESTMSN
ncbi:hypothetical protein ACFST9_20600 [Hymenobacter monticola]|uniref:Uncharacterized protein n=1 Tax=Hymenobacter monticola TaxID=1705399 RepID=A0ABY4B6T3_9BACT|nr:hypothetical protein [Hymenobacter monticola]UOE34499.1 hypothetical protein MTP16_02315 [Hymenobacter monticola]